MAGRNPVRKTCPLLGLWYTSFVHANFRDHEIIRAAASKGAGLLRAAELGVQPWSMTRMTESGVIERVVPGVYVGMQCERHPLIEVAAWTLRYPAAVACLLTAAAYHELTDAFTRGAWFFVPKGSSVPRSRTASLHVVQVAPSLIDPKCDEENGITRLIVHGVEMRLTGPDRTVLDMWKYPRRVSSEHALRALHLRSHSSDFELPRFARLGHHLGVWKRIEPVVQGMMVR